MDKIWWNHITKAHKFLEDVVWTAFGGSSIILSLPTNVPWRDTLIDLIREKLQMENPKNGFEQISCPKEEIGLYLLNKYCKKEKRATYRYGMTYAAFLGKCDDIVLNDRYIWITDIPETKVNELIEFITEYNQNVKAKTPAIFILEVNDNINRYKTKKGIKKLSFDQNISAYDKFAFCALVATENNCKDYMRPYLAELVSNICKEDIELCAECVSAGMRFLYNPVQCITSIIKSKTKSDGSIYTFSKKEEEIEKAIWETQVKYVFPLIEKYRSYFVVRHKKIIEIALPIHNSYGELITNPEDVEVGTLLYMIGREVISVSNKEYEELKKYREARNKLAHLNVLELGAVEEILRKK